MSSPRQSNSSALGTGCLAQVLRNLGLLIILAPPGDGLFWTWRDSTWRLLKGHGDSGNPKKSVAPPPPQENNNMWGDAPTCFKGQKETSGRTIPSIDLASGSGSGTRLMLRALLLGPFFAYQNGLVVHEPLFRVLRLRNPLGILKWAHGPYILYSRGSFLFPRIFLSRKPPKTLRKQRSFFDKNDG